MQKFFKTLLLVAGFAATARAEPKSLLPENIRDSSGTHARIAIILPFSGTAAATAAEMKNAAELALFNAKNPNAIFQFYDSEGTSAAAKKAAEQAVKEQASVIIGPLLKDEVHGAAKGADGQIPLISFTTDESVLDRSVYSIGQIPDDQVKRIISFASDKGYKKFAILTPDNAAGDMISTLAKHAVSDSNAEIEIRESYTKDSIGKIAEKISNFKARSKDFSTYLAQVESRLAYLQSLPQSELDTVFDATQYASGAEEIKSLAKNQANLKKRNTIDPPPFDAVFIYGTDMNEVLMMGSMLLYYGVSPSDVKYLGLSQFDNPKVFAEAAFKGAWFPSTSSKSAAQFNSAYKKYFGNEPSKMSTIAYDAAALAISSSGDLASSEGFLGLGGQFRFLKNGMNERLYDIMQVSSGRATLLAPAPTSFP